MIDVELETKSQPLASPVVNDTDSVAVIILLCNNPAFKTQEKPYNFEIWGKKMYKWVSLAVGNVKKTEIVCDVTDDIISLVRPHLSNQKYTAVFYSDTPLLSRKTFLDIMEYVTTKQLNVCKLSRGYVFDTQYLKSADKIYAPQTHYFEEEDFIAVYNLKQLSIVSDILKNRILAYHMKEGVRFIDTATVFLDADVNIGKDTVIYPNNYISGHSEIGEGCVIDSGNKINNSSINTGVKIFNSHIEDSMIGTNSSISGCEIKSAMLGSRVTVESGSYILDTDISEDTYVSAGTKIENYDGKNTHHTVIGKKVFIGAGSTLIAPLTIGDNAFIAAGSAVTDDVPASALAAGRAKQINKTDWR